ncbi:hypothetical protein DVS28_b0491 (plasmid) [Euzebya pacifica]|uniref:Uncharacterized protein n=1 Tax=Euzebya pacifica TaxID=1608957 RepID=A0A346Y6Y4_9ACTN|nr:hypothetical protein DVS28_b0491 [Euzebya pacifica]
MLADPSPQALPVRFDSNARTDADLAWLGSAGFTTVGAVNESLLHLYGILLREGPDGYLRLNRPVAGIRAIGATPPEGQERLPTTRTLEVMPDETGRFVLTHLTDYLNLTEQDIVRHALMVMRTLLEHAENGGTITPVGRAAR